jgi:hypothetical protein
MFRGLAGLIILTILFFTLPDGWADDMASDGSRHR